MKRCYNIFGDTNYFEEHAGSKRGLRKRPTWTEIFVIEGTIKLRIDREWFYVREGEEVIVPGDKWHGWVAQTDATVMQRVAFKSKDEESKDFDLS